MRCRNCGRELTRDETGLSRKLISRDGKTCLCFECLESRFRLSEAQLQELIDHFREAGCTLFR